MTASPPIPDSAARTVLLAVAIYVLGQAAQRFVLDPLSEQRKTIGEIAGALLYLGNISNVAVNKQRGQEVLLPADPAEASRTLRALAGRLRASLWAIPAYWLWSGLHIVPSKRRVLTASSGLVGWSNSLFSGDPTIHMRNVADALRLPGDY